VKDHIMSLSHAPAIFRVRARLAMLAVTPSATASDRPACPMIDSAGKTIGAVMVQAELDGPLRAIYANPDGCLTHYICGLGGKIAYVRIAS